MSLNMEHLLQAIIMLKFTFELNQNFNNNLNKLIMSQQQNITSVRQFWAVFNSHDLNGWDALCASDYINHDAGLPTPDADLSTLKQTIGGLIAAFPDMTATEEDLVAMGDKIAVRMTLSGTHQGEFMGVAGTGKHMAFGGVWLAHFSEGKYKEQWVYFDALGLLQQMGAIPAPG